MREPPVKLEDAFTPRRCEAEGQFVYQPHSRLPADGTGQGQHLLLAAAEQASAEIQLRLQFAEQLQRLIRLRAGQAKVLPDGQDIEDTAALQDDPWMGARAAIRRAIKTTPWTFTCPAYRPRKPSIAMMVVVFPAPLRPSSPTISP
jgi:hypothetical protein